MISKAAFALLSFSLSCLRRRIEAEIIESDRFERKIDALVELQNKYERERIERQVKFDRAMRG